MLRWKINKNNPNHHQTPGSSYVSGIILATNDGTKIYLGV